MRELILLRHAHAEPASAGQADLDRPLSPEGLAEAEAAGRWLAEQGLVPDCVLCSPARRTRETLEAVLGAIGYVEQRLDDGIYEATSGTLAALADAHRDADPAYQAQPAAAGYRQTGLERFVDQGILEKIALLSLILGIFASVLPGIDISTVRLVLGVIVVVMLNTVITEWLGRHGMSFETAMREFVGVALANFLIVIAYRLLVHRFGGTIDAGATLFFLFLVSIIIALYDRYRPIYLRRVDAEHALT